MSIDRIDEKNTPAYEYAKMLQDPVEGKIL